MVFVVKVVLVAIESVESVDQMLRVLVDCYGTYRGSTEDRGCVVTVSASLMDYEQMTISSIPDPRIRRVDL